MKSEEKDHSVILEKSRSGVHRVIFGRATVIALLVAIQAVLMVMIFDVFSKNVPYVFGGHMVFALIITLVIINRPGNLQMQLPWVIITLISPIVGGLLYLFVESHPGQRILEKRLESLYKETEKYIRQDEDILERLEKEDVGTANMARYIRRHGNHFVYENTEAVFFPLGEYKFQAMLEELEKAESYIFLEYFIVEKGEMWSRILEILKRKVDQGVEVRMMYDGTCAFNYLPYNYPKEMEKIGIRCKMFSPIRPVLSTHYNNRDHRKILVIDGKVGFTGGVNIGDEYINRKEKYGHWKDTAVMLKGDAVEGLTQMFLQMWNVTERREDYTKYLPGPREKKEEELGFVLPFGDSPFDTELIGETVYRDILDRAEKYVHIMTPYLIIDDLMMASLTYAAKRGVDVKLILPHIPDKKIPFALARGHYRQLLKAGVKIYEYTPGFVHAKIFVSDDKKAVVGTINLDYRSLYLHFECGAFFYQAPVVYEVEADYQKTLEQCEEIKLGDRKNWPMGQRIVGKLLKVLAPLM